MVLRERKESPPQQWEIREEQRDPGLSNMSRERRSTHGGHPRRNDVQVSQPAPTADAFDAPSFTEDDD